MEKNWAYGAFAMNSSDLGIGTIYYTAKYFEVQDAITIFNPNTNALYTADEINAIKENAAAGNDGYITDIPNDAFLGISANESGRVYWYDETNAKDILSHTDALVLNGETGAISTAADGSAVAKAIG